METEPVKVSSNTYLYVLEQDMSPIGLNHKFYKIGVTRLLNRRLQNLQTGAVVPISLHAVISVGSKEETYKLERFLHNKFQGKVCPSGNEWFALSPEDIEYIISFGKERKIRMDFSDYIDLIRNISQVTEDEVSDDVVENFIKQNGHLLQSYPTLFSVGGGSSVWLPYGYYDTDFTVRDGRGVDVSASVTLVEKDTGELSVGADTTGMLTNINLFFTGTFYDLYAATAQVLEYAVAYTASQSGDIVEVRDQGTTVKYDSSNSAASTRLMRAAQFRSMGFAIHQSSTRTDMI